MERIANILAFIFFLIFVGSGFYIASQQISAPKSVKENLRKAGENRKELVKTIRYFQEKGDSLQLQSLYFLLENMEGHSYGEVAIYDSTETEVPFFVLDFPDYETLRNELDSMETQYGGLHFALKKCDEDLQTMTSDILIENIEFAFKAWREKPWATSLNFDDFCEFILPYRGSNEPIESWRKTLLEKYQHISENMQDKTNPIEAAALINSDIKTWFTFDERFYLHPTDQGFAEMCKNGLGRCEDMTNMAIYALRANAIGITSDYTPHWADTSNNHAWNAVLTGDGEVVPFMGCESNPGEYNLRSKMAKAYRKTFARQSKNLAFKLEDWESAPSWLSGKFYSDVTTSYTKVADVILESNSIPDSTRFAYLCVFNSGEWRAIHWGKISDKNSVKFNDMGIDICYLPMFYRHKKLEPAGAPFILSKTGEILVFSMDSTKTQPVKLISTTRKTIAQAIENKEITFLENGVEYEFFYWADEWIEIGTKTATEKPLVFDDAPKNALFWLTKKDSRKQERIFGIEDGKQIWR